MMAYELLARIRNPVIPKIIAANLEKNSSFLVPRQINMAQTRRPMISSGVLMYKWNELKLAKLKCS